MEKSTEKRTISFSPPDISDAEIAEVCDTLKSGWITTGPRTKLLERRLAAYIETGRTDINTEENKEYYSNRVVCLNSATAAEELNLRWGRSHRSGLYIYRFRFRRCPLRRDGQIRRYPERWRSRHAHAGNGL